MPCTPLPVSPTDRPLLPVPRSYRVFGSSLPTRLVPRPLGLYRLQGLLRQERDLPTGPRSWWGFPSGWGPTSFRGLLSSLSVRPTGRLRSKSIFPVGSERWGSIPRTIPDQRRGVSRGSPPCVESQWVEVGVMRRSRSRLRLSRPLSLGPSPLSEAGYPPDQQ